MEEIAANVGETYAWVTGKQARTMDRATRVNSGWEPKLGVWLAICPPPFHLLDETIYHHGF